MSALKYAKENKSLFNLFTTFDLYFCISKFPSSSIDSALCFFEYELTILKALLS